MNKNKIMLFYGKFFPNQDYGWFPDSLLFPYSLLKNAGFEPILIHEYGHEDYETIFREHAQDCIFLGISCMTGPMIESSIRAVKKFRKYAPEVPVVWGGGHPTAAPYLTAKSEYCDYVHVGFTKQTFVEMTKALQAGDTPTHLPDIVDEEYFRCSGTTQYSIQDPLVDYSNFPRLALESLDYSYLITENRVLNYTSSTGCHGGCSFCTWGGKHPWVHRNLDHVLDEIEYLVNRYALRSLWISDASLSGDREYMLALAEGIKQRNLNIWWRCHGRVVELQHFDHSDFQLLEECGLDRIFVGVENVEPKVQKLFYKVFDPEKVTKLCENMKGFKIQLYMSLIFGNPGETPSTIHKNKAYIDKWKSINSRTGFQICFFTPYPGTTANVEKCGYEPPASLEEYASSPFFSDLDRKVFLLPWYEQSLREEYMETYRKLFPTTDNAPQWNWRDHE